jgi:hypothetical protein
MTALDAPVADVSVVPSPSTERRIAIRQPAVGTVCRLDADGEDRSTGLVWNISVSGVSMLVPKPLEPGSGVRGVLETIRGRHPLPVDMRVVHVKQLETGDYWMGAHFDRPLTRDEMKPFVG